MMTLDAQWAVEDSLSGASASSPQLRPCGTSATGSWHLLDGDTGRAVGGGGLTVGCSVWNQHALSSLVWFQHFVLDSRHTCVICSWQWTCQWPAVLSSWPVQPDVVSTRRQLDPSRRHAYQHTRSGCYRAWMNAQAFNDTTLCYTISRHAGEVDRMLSEELAPPPQSRRRSGRSSARCSGMG